MAYASQTQSSVFARKRTPSGPTHAESDDIAQQSNLSPPRYVAEENLHRAALSPRSEERHIAYRTRSYDTASRTPGVSETTNTHLSDLLRILAKIVHRNEFSKTLKFLDNHPDLLDGLSEDVFLGEVVTALQKGDQPLAENLVEKGLIIREFKTLHPKEQSKRVLRLQSNKGEIKKFEDQVASVVKTCDRRALALTKGSSLLISEERTPVQFPRPTQTRALMSSQEPLQRTSEARQAGTKNRHGNAQQATTGPGTQQLHENSHTERRHTAMRLERTPSNAEEQLKHLVVSPGRHEKANAEEDRPKSASQQAIMAGAAPAQSSPGFQIRPRSFYEVGRVFAMLESVPATNEDLSTTPSHESRHTQYSSINVKRWVVIRVRAHFCNVIPVHTYGGRGLRRFSIGSPDTQAHAIIYVQGTPAKEILGEPHLIKEPIEVIASHPDRRLPYGSRLHFGKVQSVEYRNMKTLDVGMVSLFSIRNLMHYWREEMQLSV